MPIAIPMAVAMPMPIVYDACVDKKKVRKIGHKKAYLAPNSISILSIVIVNINVTNYRAELNEDYISS